MKLGPKWFFLSKQIWTCLHAGAVQSKTRRQIDFSFQFDGPTAVYWKDQFFVCRQPRVEFGLKTNM